MRTRRRSCPCCGGMAQREIRKGWPAVCCMVCGLKASGRTMEEAEEKWNRRTADAILAAQREKLRELNIKLDKLEGRA